MSTPETAPAAPTPEASPATEPATYHELCQRELAALKASPDEQARVLAVDYAESDQDFKRLRILYPAVSFPNPPNEWTIQQEVQHVRAALAGQHYSHSDHRDAALSNLDRRRRVAFREAEKLERADRDRYGLHNTSNMSGVLEVSQNSRARGLIEAAKTIARERNAAEERAAQADRAARMQAAADQKAEQAAEAAVRAAVARADALDEARAVMASGKAPDDGWRPLAARLGGA